MEFDIYLGDTGIYVPEAVPVAIGDGEAELVPARGIPLYAS